VKTQLQTAINDVDAQYAMPTGARNMNSTWTGGDNLVATGVRANFVRAKVVSIPGGSGVTVQILGKKPMCDCAIRCFFHLARVQWYVFMCRPRI
jgi:hypothetical protein